MNRPAPARLTDRKRAAILDAAEAEFRQAGYEATSMDRIAASAGVSKRTVYNHFPSKEVLFAQILLFHVRDDLYENGRINTLRLRPIGRLAGDIYVRVRDPFPVARDLFARESLRSCWRPRLTRGGGAHAPGAMRRSMQQERRPDRSGRPSCSAIPVDQLL